MVWITLFVLMALSLVKINGEAIIYASCIDEDNKSLALLLDCGEGGFITDIQYEAGYGQCTSLSTACKGESASLLIDVMDCHWNRTCRLSPGWPPERIVRSSGSCYNRSLMFLKIESYRCFHNITGISDVINISNGGSMSRTSGIIRSHSEFPWNYGEVDLTHSVTLVVQRGKRLYVSALYDVDLGEDDFLNVASKSTKALSHLKSGVVLAISESNDTKVAFTFHISSFTQSGKGFAICFKFSKTEITENVCDEITTKGSLKVGVKVPNTTPVVDQTSAPETTTTQPKKCDKKCRNAKTRRPAESPQGGEERPEPPKRGGGGEKEKKKNRKNKNDKRRRRDKDDTS